MVNRKNVILVTENDVRRAIISRIKKLREAPNLDMQDSDEEENPDTAQDVAAPAPVKRVTPAKQPAQDTAAPVEQPAPEVDTEPVEQPAPAMTKPTEQPAPEVETEPVPDDTEPVPDDTEGDMIADPVPDAEGDDSDQSKIRQAKVKLFFDKLEANPTLMNYLSFKNPLEQAEAIMQFAELVRVPRSQLLPLMKTIRNISQAPETAPTAESILRRKVSKIVREHLNNRSKFKK